MPSLAEWGAKIAGARLQEERISYGPWEGSKRSVSADMVEREFIAGGSEFHYQPRSGTWKRRSGTTQRFDTFGAAVGQLPAKWGGKCRHFEEYAADSISDGIPSLISLVTKETIVSGLDDGRFSQVYIRNQVTNANYTLGSEYSGSTYPAAGSEQSYKVVPLWYDSGEGGITRGVAEFQRRFFGSGSRKFQKVGRWWYFTGTHGTPFRAHGMLGSTLRIIPSGPLPPTHAGSLAKGTQLTNNATNVYPLSDVNDGNWTGQDAGTSLFSYIDETTPSDADYITTPTSLIDTTCEIRLGPLGFTPTADESVILKYRARSTAGGKLTTTVVMNTTVIATHVATPLSGTFREYTLTLTPTQIAAITDWTNLRVRFAKTELVAGVASNYQVSHATLEQSTDPATRGGWRGSDKFYFSVAYEFEDGSIWMPCPPREPNSILTNGFNLFTVDATNLTASYESLTWSNIPIGPYGVLKRHLLRTPKIDSAVDSTLQLTISDLRVVWTIEDNVTTTYEMFNADDDALVLDADRLLIRNDHAAPPRTRYIAGGESRIAASYGGISPVAITLAPIGRTTDYDLNADDEIAGLYTQNSSYYRVTATALELVEDTGAALATTSFAFATYDTLQKLVDAINDTNVTDDGRQWRAQLMPGANAQAATATHLTLTTRDIASCDVSGQTITKISGLSVVPVGAWIQGTGATNGAYVSRIDTDQQLTFVGTVTSGTKTLTFTANTGDAPTGTDEYDGYVRVIANSLPGFLFFNSTYLDQFPIEKDAIWMTVGSPGSVQSAANCFSGRKENKHRPPANAGHSMGVAAVDNGFVTPFSNKRAVIRMRPDGSGLDRDFRLVITNQSSGCCAWGSLCEGPGVALMFSPEGWIGQDLEGEYAFSEATWLHAPTAKGDYTYEAPLCIASTAQDTDTAYLMAKVLRSALWVNYRASGSHPNRQVVYDFSTSRINRGLGVLVRDVPILNHHGQVVVSAGRPWGWSKPFTRSMTAMAEGRRSDGLHLYGWNDENAGSTGDGRIDEFETSDTDNGTAISGSVTTPWYRSDAPQFSAHRFTVEHSTPAGATVALDFHRSLSDTTYSFTPSVSSSLIYSRDPKDPNSEARVQTAAGYLGWRQSAGGASELKSIAFRVFPIHRSFK